MPISLILPRHDSWIPTKKLNTVYSLSLLQKIFGNSSSELFYPLIKQTLLCSNFIFWYSNYPLMLSLILNFIIFNITISFYSLTDQKDSGLSNTQIILLNIPNWISFISFFSFFTIRNKHIITQMHHYARNIIMKHQNKIIINHKDEEKYSFEIGKNFDLIITQLNQKNGNDNDELVERGNYFEYVINVPNIPFHAFYYDSLLEKREKELIREIISYLHQQEMIMKKKRFNFIMMLMIWMVLLYFQSLTMTLISTFSYYICVIGLSYLFHSRESQGKINQLKEYIKEINKEIIHEGYYIDVSDYLISLFALKRDYNMLSLTEVEKEIERLKVY